MYSYSVLQPVLSVLTVTVICVIFVGSSNSTVMCNLPALHIILGSAGSASSIHRSLSAYLLQPTPQGAQKTAAERSRCQSLGLQLETCD